MSQRFPLITITAISALLIAAKAPVTPSLEGVWKGSGIVSYRHGADHAECRVRYTRAGSKSFSYAAACATASGKYDLTGSVTNTSGSRYSGTVVGGGQQGRETGRVFLIQRGKYLTVSVTSRRVGAHHSRQAWLDQDPSENWGIPPPSSENLSLDLHGFG